MKSGHNFVLNETCEERHNVLIISSKTDTFYLIIYKTMEETHKNDFTLIRLEEP